MTSFEKNCISTWFPLIAAAGLPVPRTEIVTTDVDLNCLLNGETFDGTADCGKFMVDLYRAHVRVAKGDGPAFLRTGHTANKHEWRESCYVQSPIMLPFRVINLVQFSAIAGAIGLPTDTWAVRELLKTAPAFHAFHGLPITKEFRFFATATEVTHIQPYWPPDAIQDADTSDRESLLAQLNKCSVGDTAVMIRRSMEAAAACAHIHPHWSVDWLWTQDRGWVLTDMAIAEESYKWGHVPEKEEPPMDSDMSPIDTTGIDMLGVVSNAICITRELPSSMLVNSMGQIDVVGVAAVLLAQIEAEPEFEWEHFANDWESVCRLIALRMIGPKGSRNSFKQSIREMIGPRREPKGMEEG